MGHPWCKAISRNQEIWSFSWVEDRWQGADNRKALVNEAASLPPAKSMELIPARQARALPGGWANQEHLAVVPVAIEPRLLRGSGLSPLFASVFSIPSWLSCNWLLVASLTSQPQSATSTTFPSSSILRSEGGFPEPTLIICNGPALGWGSENSTGSSPDGCVSLRQKEKS